MILFSWFLLALAIYFDISVIRLLHKRKAVAWTYIYSVFALLTDLAPRIIPIFNQGDEAKPMLSIFCGYVFMLTFMAKMIIAVGRALDRFLSSHHKGWTITAIIAAALFLGTMIAGTIIPTHSFRVEHEEMHFPNLPEGFDGTRIGFFTDIHLGALTTADKIITQMVDSLNANKCLFAINGGDLLYTRNVELNALRRAQLTQITAPVYSVIGNHDLGYYRRDTLEYTVAQSTSDFKAAIDSLGWTRLDNSSVWIHSRGDSLRLTGIEFHRSVANDRHKRSVGGVNVDSLIRADVPLGTFNIVASHIPQYWQPLCETHGGDLTLSGHTHAMQCKIRIFGREWSPAALLYDQWSGTYRNGHKILYISEGVGFTGIPIRLGSAPSITIITLRKCE